ncbi:MAG: F0F1 ATP synthase subunit delta [Roseimicrobium sp.]
MKIDKNSARAARQMFRACVDANGRLQSNRVKTVVRKLAQAKPRGYLAILSAFERLVRLEVQKRQALIESASLLSPQVREQMRADLQRKYGEELEFDFNVNPDLIGGLRVQVGSHVWDGSIRARLESLRTNLA